MQSTDVQTARAAEVLSRWSAESTTLSCVAGIAAGPRLADAAIHLPACTLSIDPASAYWAFLSSTDGSFLVLSEWESATAIEVHTTARGTTVEVLFRDATLTIADYDCLEDVTTVN